MRFRISSKGTLPNVSRARKQFATELRGFSQMKPRICFDPFESATNGFYPDAIMGTAASAATSPTSLQRVKCSFRNMRARSTVTAGYSDEMTTASSRRPLWLAWTKSMVPRESMQPVTTPHRMPAGVMSRKFLSIRTISEVTIRPPVRVSVAIHKAETSPASRTDK